MGAMQAIATIFGIRDLHRENVLVHQRQPYLIDLEVCFNLQELLNPQGLTGLHDAIKFPHHPEDTNIMTPNNTILIIDQSTKLSHQKHFEQNYKHIYKNEIQSGFDHAIKILSDNENQEALFKFIDELPNDLKIRFVPKSTLNHHHGQTTNH